MKTLRIPPESAARMVDQTRADRAKTRTLPGWANDDPPVDQDGNGGCAFVACLILALGMYAWLLLR